MQNIAMYWLVLQLTGPVGVGILSFARFAPAALLAPFAGTLADRLDNRRTVMATQAAQMFVASVLAVLVFGGHAQAWHLYVAAVFIGSIHCLDTATRANLTFEMVGRQELPNAVALNNTLFNAARVGGPALAGIVISFLGVGWCFGVNTVSFLAVLTCLALMRRHEFFPLARDEERLRLWAGTREGLVFVRSQPRITAVLTLTTVYAMLIYNVDVLLPFLTKQTLHQGPGTFALLMSLFGIGALVGALGVASTGRASWRSIVASAALLALVALAIAPLRSTEPVALLLFFGGISFATLTVNANALLQLETPDRLRGRVLSLYFLSWTGLAPLGALLIAWLCAAYNTTVALTAIGTVGLLTVGLIQWRLHPSSSDAEVAEPAFSTPVLPAASETS
jgi:MFS family permease